jgi:hypothetical protein
MTPAIIPAGIPATYIFPHLKFIRFRNEGVSNVLRNVIVSSNQVVLKRNRTKVFGANSGATSFTGSI